MKIFYRKFEIQDKERVNELISRTTKFNNIGEKNKNLKMDVLVYKDNYFEHGIVGVIGYEIKNSVMKLELVCISCRLYARGIVEYIIGGYLQLYIKSKNVKQIFLVINETQQNVYLQILIKKIGFMKKSEKMYELYSLNVKIPNYVEMIDEVTSND